VKKPAANLSASVRQRLLNLATERKEDFGLLLTRYGLERFLYRLSISPHRDTFVLRGGSVVGYFHFETARKLNYFAYNFIKIHRTLRTSPAMAAGVTDRLWSVEDLVVLWEAYEQRRAERAA
jgi:hypothetical protein